jgi:DNA polymerase III delta subunit
MIQIFTGDDRVRAQQEIKKLLGKDYEVVEGTEINLADLPSIFYGASLFCEKRKILIRDFTVNKPAYGELSKYLDTPHEIILFETKLDKRSIAYKEIKDKISVREFDLPEDPNFKQVFNTYRTAKTDGPRAIKMLESIKPNEDPIKFTGLLVSQAIKDFSMRQGNKEKKVLKALSKLDLEMKSTKIDPWLLVESFLLELSTF